MKKLLIAGTIILLTSCASNKAPNWYADPVKADPDCAFNVCGTGESEYDGTPISLAGAREESRTYAMGDLSTKISTQVKKAVSLNQTKLGKTVNRSFSQQVQTLSNNYINNVECKYTTADDMVYALCKTAKPVNDTTIDHDVKKLLQETAWGK